MRVVIADSWKLSARLAVVFGFLLAAMAARQRLSRVHRRLAVFSPAGAMPHVHRALANWFVTSHARQRDP
jgi:hypothetical protein